MDLSAEQCIAFVAAEMGALYDVPPLNAAALTHRLVQAYGQLSGNLCAGAPLDFLGYALSTATAYNSPEALAEALATDVFLHPSFDTSRAQWNASLQRLDAERQAMGSGVFTCRRCGSRAVTVTTVQVRSADEGMTEVRTCRDCGNVSRINA